MTKFLFLLLLYLAARSVCGAEPSNGSEFQPGLLAEYRSLMKNPVVLPVRRIDAKPSFTSGDGLLGPLTLTFDPKGRLWVGSITQPGWMAQPDRGGLFRIEYTGKLPFEVQSIHVRPKVFRLVFTKTLSPESATGIGSYAIKHFRYEFSGAYGSPELDQNRVLIDNIALSEDKKAVDLTTVPLVKDRVYSITANGIRSTAAEPLLHATGVYTLKTIPIE